MIHINRRTMNPDCELEDTVYCLALAVIDDLDTRELIKLLNIRGISEEDKLILSSTLITER